jgi:high affinity sulfate transporter 1
VAVLSTLTGNIVLDIAKSHPDIPGPVVASALAVIAGAIVTFLGFARLGFLVELIPLTAIAAFMTGSAINIAVGQVPGLMGITGFNTRAPTYWVIINTLKGLPGTQLDAAIGLTALALLYFIRIGCSIGQKKFPTRQKVFFYIATLRTAFVILLYTMIGWLVQRHHKKKPTFKILGKVPRGFTAAGVPQIDTEIVSTFASQLPAVIIVMLIEHISISKSFGRVNNYTIKPSQELIAMGITNLFGPFLGAYPATGSFSRTAIKSKAGVRTPLAGVITGIVVLLAIYALTAVFYYIPNAALSAVIIHAVGDLITSPKTLYQFWRISPIELPIWAAGVLVTIFSSIENGIYTTISVSAALLLFRILKAHGRFLGKVKIHSVVGDAGSKGTTSPGEFNSEDGTQFRTTFLPVDHHDGTNPAVEVLTPYEGIFIFRFSEGFIYPNASHYLSYLTEYIFAHTRRTDPNNYAKLGVSFSEQSLFAASIANLNRIALGTTQVLLAVPKPLMKAVLLSRPSSSTFPLSTTSTLPVYKTSLMSATSLIATLLLIWLNGTLLPLATVGPSVHLLLLALDTLPLKLIAKTVLPSLTRQSSVLLSLEDLIQLPLLLSLPSSRRGQMCTLWMRKSPRTEPSRLPFKLNPSTVDTELPRFMVLICHCSMLILSVLSRLRWCSKLERLYRFR